MASYFVRNQSKLRLPVGLGQADTGKGLRRGQIGAYHGISTHFALDQDQAAIVVMPTGSGKTGVLMLAPFLLGARRALVITPSRLVRQQIVSGLRTLDVLETADLLPRRFPRPTVLEVRRQRRTLESWEELRGADLVVAIPSSISPAYKKIVDPPEDLFDLILVDEAHHLPADTWSAVVGAFPEARRVLFTATPFRRDEKEIEGKFVFVYPIEQAFKEGIFSEIAFLPVEAGADATQDAKDRAVARRAEAVFREDREAGLDHVLMVRTDERNRADELLKIYAEETGLMLKAIHSGIRDRAVEATVHELRDGKLDGIICVDMLGEGFDFPKLKIAAIHSPHKSLSATLQFIGRFARGGREKLGTAKFLAVPSDITIQSVELYEESATWQQIVPGLLEQGVAREVRAKEVISSFTQRRDSATEDAVEKVSLFTLRPYFHVRAYEVGGAVALDGDISLGPSSTIEYRWTSAKPAATIVITREQLKPQWTTLNVFQEVRHDLFIVYRSNDGRFLFICSSDRSSDAAYEVIAKSLCPGGYWPISEDTARKAHLGLTEHEQFMVGLRNVSQGNRGLTYAMRTGRTVNRSIDAADGQMYNLGHSFGSASEDGRRITIGLSESGKIWSNTADRIPDLLEWCERLATRFASDTDVVTGSELDLLRTGRAITQIPGGVISAVWNEESYDGGTVIRYIDKYGVASQTGVQNAELKIEHDLTDNTKIHLLIEAPRMSTAVEFRLSAGRWFSLPSADPHSTTILRGRLEMPLLGYLNAYPPKFTFWDLAYLSGSTYYQAPSSRWDPFPPEGIDAVDWAGLGVSINREYGAGSDGLLSIHEHLERRLAAESPHVMYCDHGSLEVADYIAVAEEVDYIRVTLYHCKATKEPKAGARVEDFYEVCGQVEKSVAWVQDIKKLRDRMESRLRFSRDDGSDRFVLGSLAEMDRIVTMAKRKRVLYRVVIVQPGLSKAALSEKVQYILGASEGYIGRFGCDKLTVIASA